MLAALSSLPANYATVAQLSARQRQLHHDWLAGIGGGCPQAGSHRDRPCRYSDCEHWRGVCCHPRNPVNLRRRSA